MKKVRVTVYELKPKEDIGHKLCSNICTGPVEEILARWGFNPKNYIQKTYTKLKIFTRKKSIKFPIREHELNRVKLVEDLITKAQENGAKFNFSTKFVDFKKLSEGKFEIIYEKDGRKQRDFVDYIIGADGAVSEFARKAGFWKDRKHFLYLQGKVSKKQVSKQFAPGKNTQHVFVGKGFGYYSYIYPSGDGFSVGLGDEMDKNIRNLFDEFSRYAGVTKYSLRGALIPLAKVIGYKDKLFVMGDAACETKFSLGGIIPSMMSAEAVYDIIVENSYNKYLVLKSRLFIHQIATKILKKLDEEDFEELFQIMKDPKFKDLMETRDKYGFKEILTLFSPKLVWFSLKNILKP